MMMYSPVPVTCASSQCHFLIVMLIETTQSRGTCSYILMGIFVEGVHSPFDVITVYHWSCMSSAVDQQHREEDLGLSVRLEMGVVMHKDMLVPREVFFPVRL